MEVVHTLRQVVYQSMTQERQRITLESFTQCHLRKTSAAQADELISAVDSPSHLRYGNAEGSKVWA
jgi:hypothetical protein